MGLSRTLFMALALIVGSALLVTALDEKGTGSSSRGPASVDRIDVSKAQHEWFEKMRTDLRKAPIVSVGETRIPEREAFQFGPLKGEFKVWIDPKREGRVWKLERVHGNSVISVPEILSKHANLFVVDFASISLESSQENLLTYRLQDRSGQVQGHARARISTSGQIESVELKSL